ncbi:hypothetical protein DMW57_06745 [Serratia marcescens]|nr:hypothetical protein DMW57_06745 [Serratia marcescens]
MGATQAPYGDVEPDDPIEQLAFTHSAEGNIMHNRHPPLTTTTTGQTAASGWSWISRELAEGCEKELTTKPSQNREQRLAFIVTAVLKV